MEERKLSEILKVFRIDRPDEWAMDFFIERAIKLEKHNKELIKEAKEDMHKINMHIETSIMHCEKAKELEKQVEELKLKVKREQKTTSVLLDIISTCEYCNDEWVKYQRDER